MTTPDSDEPTVDLTPPLPPAPHDEVPKRMTLGTITYKVDVSQVADVIRSLETPRWKGWLLAAYRAFVVVMLIGIAAAHCACAAGKTPAAPEVEPLTRSIESQSRDTVLIISPCGVGSGFIVSERHVITAAHVVRGCLSTVFVAVEIEGAYGEDPRTHLLVPDHLIVGADIARLTSTDPLPGDGPRFVEPARVGDRVCSETAFPPPANRACGVVLSVSEDEDGLEHTIPVQKGNSGSAIYNERGAIVGVITTCNYDPIAEECLDTGGGGTTLASRSWLLQGEP